MDLSHGNPQGARARLVALTIGAIGVVYGDIGTSPLYALKECFSHHYGLNVLPPEILGIISLVFWSLTIIICVKYLALIMRFDNKGEGGILALMELVSKRKGTAAGAGILFAMGIFGASLLYGDGIITPAISVLSAVEGLTVAAPALSSVVFPITIVVLLALFVVQKYGTGGVGKVFGPFMVFWFILLGFLGLVSMLQTPSILQAANPIHAINFFVNNGLAGFKVLGSVFLVVTGGETVYADMGHFGVKPIRRGWFLLVYPCLILNYFGQGALLMREGNIASTVENPFFHLVPTWAVIPLVITATFATIIASQAVISGAFSLTWQALQLGYLPRMKVLHTSRDERGQIYIPALNWILFIATVILVVQFKTSGNLAAAYGIAVTTTMVITSVLGYFALRRIFQWSFIPAIAVTGCFLLIDGSFFTANLFKIADGGWVPIVLALATYMLMLTWHRGRELLSNAIRARNLSLKSIIVEEIDRYEIVPGTALYMSGYAGTAPPALISNLKYNRVRHETIVLLTVDIETVAHVPRDQRFEVLPMEKNIYQVVLSYGFMDQLNLMDDLLYLPEFDIPVDITDAIFVLGHETLTVNSKEHMARWRKEIFVYLHRNSRTPARYFGIPVKRTLEVGSHIAL